MAVSLLIAPPAYAQTAEQTENDRDQRIEALEKMVNSLTQTINELRQEVKELKEAPPPPAPPPPPPPEENVEVFIPEDEPGISLPTRPELNIYGFGSISYDYVHKKNPDDTLGDTNNFTKGNMSLFITSRLSDRISFFNENLFKFKPTSEGDPDLVVQRLLLEYSVTPWLDISIGRGHSALGYWSKHFHSGLWLQTTTDSPKFYADRKPDQNGHAFLISHYHGIEFNGTLENSAGSLEYTATVANGRGATTDHQDQIDLNDSKYTSLLLTYEPAAIKGLGFGPFISHDVIPPLLDDEAPIDEEGREDEIDENVLGFHLYYTKHPYELLAEHFWVEHYNHSLGDTFRHSAGYIQLAYSIRKWKPYYRFENITIARADPFYQPDFEDENINIAGIRYDLTDFNAIKLECRLRDSDLYQATEYTIQSAFAF